MKFPQNCLLVIVLPFLYLSCMKSNVKDGCIQKPGVAFTFDDNYIDNWYQYLPLLDSFGVKATFYISGYKRLNSSQKQKLKEIGRRGHEIAFHSTNHYNLKQYLNNASMEQLVEKEIKEGLQKMNADGFYPRTFAYPYGQHTAALDVELLKYFKSLRLLNGTNNLGKSVATDYNNRMLYGLGIDESSKRPFESLLQLISEAKEKNACVVFLAHRIEKKEMRMHLPLSKLRALILEAVAQRLRFYTISEISN